MSTWAPLQTPSCGPAPESPPLGQLAAGAAQEAPTWSTGHLHAVLALAGDWRGSGAVTVTDVQQLAGGVMADTRRHHLDSGSGHVGLGVHTWVS